MKKNMLWVIKDSSLKNLVNRFEDVSLIHGGMTFTAFYNLCVKQGMQKEFCEKLIDNKLVGKRKENFLNYICDRYVYTYVDNM